MGHLVQGNLCSGQLLSFNTRLAADSLSDILEIKVTVKPADESSEGDQHLGEWGVNVHKELLSNVLCRETTKVDFVKATRSAA